LPSLWQQPAPNKALLQNSSSAAVLLPFYEFVLTTEDYKQPKSAPAPYLAALQRFGVVAGKRWRLRSPGAGSARPWPRALVVL
jgi:hypothetical protein